MDRKAKPIDSNESEQSAISITFLGRFAQMMSTKDDPSSSGGRQLEELLQNLPNTPWFKKLSAEYLLKLNALSDSEWKQKVIEFCEFCGPGISQWCVSAGMKDPLINRAPEEKSRIIVEKLLKQNNFGKNHRNCKKNDQGCFGRVFERSARKGRFRVYQRSLYER